MLVCPLCNKQVPSLHKKSHLIPEWMFKDVYDSSHKLTNIDLNKEKVKKIQKGFYDSIICSECEKESGIYDCQRS